MSFEIHPLWVPHRQSPDYDEKTHNILHEAGYFSECIACYGMCQVGEDAYFDTEEDEGPICSPECYDKFFGKDKHVNYEWYYREKIRYSDAIKKIMKDHLLKLLKGDFSEDFQDKFEINIEVNVNFRIREELNERRNR